MTKLLRQQIKRNMDIQSYNLNITVGSGQGLGKIFAPTWAMVKEHKNKVISDEEYTNQYIKILDNISDVSYQELIEFGIESNNKICFLCYCKDNSFCHTYILIDYLINLFPHLFE